MIHRRDLPYYKPRGKRVLFKKSELDAWIEKGRYKSHEEIDVEAATYVALSELGMNHKAVNKTGINKKRPAKRK